MLHLPGNRPWGVEVLKTSPQSGQISPESLATVNALIVLSLVVLQFFFLFLLTSFNHRLPVTDCHFTRHQLLLGRGPQHFLNEAPNAVLPYTSTYQAVQFPYNNHTLFAPTEPNAPAYIHRLANPATQAAYQHYCQESQLPQPGITN